MTQDIISSSGGSPLAQRHADPAEQIQRILGQVPRGNLGGTDQAPPPGQGAAGSGGGGEQIEIPPPDQEAFSDDELALILEEWSGKVAKAMSQTSRATLESRQAAIAAATRDAKQKIEDYYKKCDDIHRKSKIARILGWLPAIGTFLAASAALFSSLSFTVMTGGAASPTLALSLVAFVNATGALANQISAETGGGPVDLGTQVTGWLSSAGVHHATADAVGSMFSGDPVRMSTAIAKTQTDDPDTLMYVGITAAILTALIAMQMGSGSSSSSSEMAPADEAARAAAKGAAESQQIANVAMTGGNAMMGASQAAQGGMSIELGLLQNAADATQSHIKENEALLKLLDALAKQEMHNLLTIVKGALDQSEKSSEIVRQFGQVGQAVVSHIGAMA